MGACEFENMVQLNGENIDTAFTRVREAALWDYGHAGYTGTIAEKHGYVAFDVSNHDLDVEEIHTMICSASYDEEVRRAADRVLGPGTVSEILRIYDDKWGPAVALHDDEYVMFCGWASY